MMGRALPVPSGRRLAPARAAPPAPCAPRRPRLRLWLPVSLLWILLAPLAVLALPFVAVVVRGRRINPARLLAHVGRLLFALSGTVVEVEAPHISLKLRLF